ncbi:MAG: hypothetical protein HY876_02365 [Coriobacteriales bacterium]|nr:hypothetical protein [Coriobacteriales bacterium]
MHQVRVLLAALMVVTLCAWPGAATAAQAPSQDSPKVREITVVLAPYVTWDDITPKNTPTLWKLASSGAIANVNARSRAASVGLRPSPLDGPLTLSAGLWSTPAPAALPAVAATEAVGTETGEEAYQAVFGTPWPQRPAAGLPKASMAYLGLPATERFQDDRSIRAANGALGQAIVDAGGATAAVGNADLGVGNGVERFRLAPLAAMDSRGTVLFGNISPSLLETDAASPYGVRTDVPAVDTALAQARRDMDEARDGQGIEGPRLFVVDSGDTVRAAFFSQYATEEAAAAQRAKAMRALDRVVAGSWKQVPQGGTLVLTSQSLDGSAGQPEGLGPVVLWNGDGETTRMLTSDSTHRDGLITQLDVTATIFDLFGLERPVAVLGDPVREVGALPSVGETVAYLDSLNSTARAIDAGRPEVINVFVTAAVLVLLFGAIVISRWRKWRPAAVIAARGVVNALVLLVLSAPPAAWLMFVVWRFPPNAEASAALLAVTTLVIWGASMLMWRFAPMRVPVAALSLATAALLLVDQLVGYPFSFVNYFGYSPLLGARFYGMGNEASAIVFGALLAGTALIFDQWPDSKLTAIGRRWLVPVVGMIVVGIAAAPGLGANVGVAVWGTFGILLAWWLFNGHRVTWRLGAIMVISIVLLIGVLAVLDLTGATQTHLGRAITSAQRGGIIELWNIVARKAATNARVFTRTNYSYILIAVLVYLGYMRWRPSGEFADTLRRNRYFAQAITVMLATGALAFFTEDSGIIIPALISLYLGTGLEWLMLARLRPDTAEGTPPERIAPPEDEATRGLAEGVRA